MPPTSTSYLLASLAGAPIAFPVTSVREVLRAVALTPVPSAPAVIEGALNLRGTLVPVVDLRHRLGLAPKPIALEDNIIVLEFGHRLVAVRVDSTDDVEAIEDCEVVSGTALSPALVDARTVAGVATRPDGAMIVYDAAAFLSEAESASVETAISGLRA